MMIVGTDSVRDTSGSRASSSPRDFQNPHTIANRFGRLLWGCVYWTVYRWTPPRLGMPGRRFILRLFGAQLGRTWIHPTARIWWPARLRSGDDVYIDRDCNLYNAFGCFIADRVVISFGTVICTATHDYESPGYPLTGGPIRVADDAWIAAQAFIFPDVTIGNGAVVGARSVVTKDVAEWTIVAGNPARFLGPRELRCKATFDQCSPS
jgi:putative colanic acid biosynthesis acetyltransferase WcaF